MSHQFFGPDNRLFGTYHPARGKSNGPGRASRAMVFCPPLGQEYMRSNWCLRLMAGQLARKGISVLRFDYRGIGDSTRSIVEIDSLAQWQTDIRSAIEFMQQKSGATNVTLFGLRAGAALAANVARDNASVHSLMLWEPIWNGAGYLNDLRSLHASMLDLWVCKMNSENNSRGEEILGTLYSRSVLDELEQLQTVWSKIQQPHLVFDLAQTNERYRTLDSDTMRKVEFTDDEDSWTDLQQLETAWLRPKTTRNMVAGAVDLFNRLEKFEMLTSSVVEV